MCRHTFFLGCIAVLIVLMSTDTTAQEKEEQRVLMRLVTTEGEQYDGYVMGRKTDTLRFETSGGVLLTLPVSKVKTIEMLAPGTLPEPPSVSGKDKTVYDHPAVSLFAMPTAYPLNPGEVHLGLYELFFASGSVGIGGFADVSMGTIILPSLIFQTFIAGAKIAPYSGDGGAIAFGAVLAGYEDDNALMLFGVGTVAIGTAWISGGFATTDEGDGGIITLGFDLPVSRVTRLMSEFWIPTEGEGFMFSVGARVETEIMYIDFGMYIPTEQGSSDLFMFLPWLGGTFLL